MGAKFTCTTTALALASMVVLPFVLSLGLPVRACMRFLGARTSEGIPVSDFTPAAASPPPHSAQSADTRIPWSLARVFVCYLEVVAPQGGPCPHIIEHSMVMLDSVIPSR